MTKREYLELFGHKTLNRIGKENDGLISIDEIIDDDFIREVAEMNKFLAKEDGMINGKDLLNEIAGLQYSDITRIKSPERYFTFEWTKAEIYGMVRRMVFPEENK